MFADRLTMLVFTLASAMLVLVLELVRQRRLAEQFSLVWLAAAIAIVLLTLSRGLLDQLAIIIGINYPPSALFVVGFMALMGMLLYYSIVVTKLTHENRKAAQRIGLLSWQVQQLQKRFEHLEDTPKGMIE